MSHVTCLVVSAAVLALIAIYQFLGVGETIALPEWLATKTWTPAGGLLPLATFLGVILLGNLRSLSNLGKSEVARQRPRLLRGGQLLRAAATVVILAGLGATIYQLAVANWPILLPHSTGWIIAVEAFKNHPLFGIGPGQFITAFTRFKPLDFNQTSLWAFRFVTSSNYYLNLLTEMGAVGLGAWLWVVYKVLTQLAGAQASSGSGTVKVQQPARQSLQLQALAGGAGLLPIAAVFLLLAFLPANFLLLLLFYLLLANWAVSLPETQRLKISLVAFREGLVAVERTELGQYYGEEETGGKIEILPWLVFVPTVVLVLGSFYFLSRVYAAELDYKKSLDAAAANKGKETYDLQIAAITKNPYFDHYRTSYSQVNLALANNIASRADLPAGEAGLTDQDRVTITQLVQQAVREGKAAVALNQVKVTNWENLASLYRALINFAQGADQWTIAAYTQAINLDPFNPKLRIDLGGAWYALGNFELAQRQFELAVNLKPDLANAHYNLAAALREQEKPEHAQQELQTTLSLLEVGSVDYERVKNELETLKEGIKAKEATPAAGLEEITPPTEAPEGIEPPLDLGEEVGPEITPSPSPEVSPTVSPSPTPTVEP